MKFRNGSIIRRLAATCLGLTALLSVTAGRCEADLLLRVEPTTAAPGDAGAFDVYLEVLSGSYDVSSFSFGLETAPGSGILFTGATADSLTAAYIFGSLQSPDYTYSTLPAFALIAGDSSFTAPGFVTLSAGDVVGLGRVSFAVAAGTPAGDVALSFLLNGETEILDASGGLLTFDVAPAAITVTSNGVVPEPASFALLALAVAPLLAAARRRAG